MADVSVKMGVSGVQQFKSSMADAQASIKTLDAALKLNQKQMKANGDEESTMAANLTILNEKLKKQKEIAKTAETALKQMRENGIEPGSKAYETMQQKMLEARSAMLDTEAEIQNIGTKASGAATKADDLSSSLSGISKKMSLDQVISGIGSITSAMETAASKAVELGTAIWDNVMNSAKWADDTETMAMMWDIPVETLQKMQYVSTTMDTSVDAILGSQDKLKKGVGSNSAAVMDYLEQLGVATKLVGKNGEEAFEYSQDPTELFWETGEALMSMSNAYDKEAAAQTLFGKSWKELIPLFSEFSSLEEYQDALENAKYVDEDQVDDLASLNDAVEQLNADFDVLERKVTATLAPALTTAANALSGLMDKLLSYLETEEGQKMLDDLTTAVSGLFSDLENIDPADIVSGFVGVFNTVIDSLEWLVENKESVANALKGIVAAWGALKLTGGALQVLNLVNGVTGLTGGASSAASAGATMGSSWGAAFGAAVIKAVPWLAGIAVLFDTSNAGSNDLMDSSGNLTNDFWMNYKDGDEYAREVVAEREEILKSRYGITLADIEADEALRNAAFNMDYGSDEELFKTMEEKYGWTPNETSIVSNNSDFSGKAIQDKIAEMESLGIEINPEVPEDAEKKISEEIGSVDVYGVLHILDANGNEVTISDWSGLGGMNAVIGGSHANGLWSVPFDGYTAILHKGERVMSAREVENSRNFSSNLYVESMYMNNGTDAAGLASAMAAAQRRTMYGYGS